MVEAMTMSPAHFAFAAGRAEKHCNGWFTRSAVND